MKILTVDDSRMIRQIIKNTIQSLGHDVLEAPNADVALEILKEHHSSLALILLDWNMPGMNGYELLKVIKSTDEYKEIPVMMVTTEGERQSVIKAIQSGANNYLTKPFTPEDLATKVIECVGMATEIDDFDLDDLDF